MSLATKHIFLDTNIYEENNFFHSTNIQSIFNYSKSGIINLYLTDISRLELIDRMQKNLLRLRDDYNLIIKNINKNRILNNIQDFHDISQPLINPARVLDQLTRKLNRIITVNKILIIPSRNIDCYDVFYKYFNVMLPFSTTKNLEFKDAFILKAVESWCITNRKKIFFITKDNDFKGYRNPRIILRDKLPELLVEISEHFDVVKNVRIIPTLEKSLKTNEEQILSLINEEVRNLFILDVDYEKSSPLNVSFPRFSNYMITSLRDDYAEINYEIEVDYDFTIFPTLKDFNRTLFEDNIQPKPIKQTIKLTCDLEIKYNRPNHIELKWVNSNQKVRITV